MSNTGDPDTMHHPPHAPHRRGFTLMELLVVIAIIGLIATAATVGVGRARTKARDTKRSADTAQLQKAFSLYAASQSGYPLAATPTCLNGSDAVSRVLITTGVMQNVPGDPIAPNTAPGGAGAAHCYSYTSTDGSTYTLRYFQETASERGPAGTISLSP